MKGLPIRQWRQVEQSFGPSPEVETLNGKQLWPELPMPRDSHLLPLMSQQLLRAARAGRIFQPSTQSMDEDDKVNLAEDDEVKDRQLGFVAKRWTVIPQHQEEPEREHLAKRRKGLAPLAGSVHVGAAVPATATRKTKVRKIDAEGNAHIYEVLAPEGQKIEGEVVEEDEAAKTAPVEAAAAPGTIVEGLGVVNEQGVIVANDLLQQRTPRRKAPPRRKPRKGPGRGRRKVIPGAGTGGAMAPNRNAPKPLPVPGTHSIADPAGPSTQGDTPMPDAQNGDEEEGSGSEGEDGEEGEDGDEGEDDEDREEGELSPTPDPNGSQSHQTPRPVKTEEQLEHEAPATHPNLEPPETILTVKRDASSSPELPLASKSNHSRQSSTVEKPLADVDSTASLDPPEDMQSSASQVDLFGSLEQALEKER